MKYYFSPFRLPLLFLIAFACPILISCGNGKAPSRDASAGKSRISVDAVIVRPQELRNVISTTGTLMASEEVALRPELSGRVISVNFQEGKKVRKGDLLIKINDAELQAQLKEKRAEEKQSIDDESRKRRLFDTKGISQEEYDKSLNSLHMVQAQREAIESKLAETEIRAPFDGTIGLRYVSEGAYVTPDVLVATMQDIGTMKVEFSVSEKYAQKLRNGTEITVRAGDSPDGLTGTVYAVESRIDTDTRTIRARARIPNPNGLLFPGAFAKVELTIEQLSDALVIPSEAVIPDVTGETVFLCKNGKAVSVPVTTGLRSETGTQVLSGLVANDTVLVTGIMQLIAGKDLSIKTIRNK